MSDFEDETLRKTIRAFYEGAKLEALEKATGKKSKYSQKLFDDYEADLKKGKKPKGKPKDEPEEEITEEDDDS